MAFTMRVSRRFPNRKRRRVVAALIGGAGSLWLQTGRRTLAAQPENEQKFVTITHAALREAEGWWVLDAKLTWAELPAIWRSLLEKGVKFPFAITFRLLQVRWWWTDQVIWGKRWTFQLQYRPGTRIWWLQHNGSVVAKGSWHDAIAPVTTLRGWRLLERDRLTPNPELEAEVTVSVDERELGPVLRLPSAESRDRIDWAGTPYRWRPWA